MKEASFVLFIALVGGCWTVNEHCNDTDLSASDFIDSLCYDKWARPNNGSYPLTVYVRMYIYFVGAIEAQYLQFTTNVLLSYKWKDKRLARDGGVIEGEKSLLGKLWNPHLYVVNEQDSKVMGSGEDVLLTIHSDGTVHQSTRMKMSLLCLMNLQKFPFDSQNCPIVLESWGYNTSQINLEWEEDSPVTVNSDLELTEYNLAYTWTTKSTNSYLIPRLEKPKATYSKFYGDYSSLTVLFRFEREIGHYIMDYYVPSILLVVVSWVSFWLDPNAVPGRITLGTSTMLTFITLSRNIGSSLPKVSYIKATEIWFIVCTAFIFGSLVEFAFVNTIWRRRKNVELKKVNSKYILRSTLTPQTKRKVIPSMERNESFTSLEESKISKSSSGPKYNSQLTVVSLGSISRDPFPFTSSESDVNEGKNNSAPQKGFFTMTPQEIAQWIDRRSRLVFPCSFIVFNCLYWTFVYIEF